MSLEALSALISAWMEKEKNVIKSQVHFSQRKFADRNVCVLACKCQSVWGDMKAANKTTTISGNTELTHVTWV